MNTGLARSVQTRLVRHAKAIGVDPNLILARYATERLLYRLSRSRHAERFVLKGALLLLVWLGETIRPTRDADLLGFGDLDPAALWRTFAEICAVGVEPDGLTFDADSIRVIAIRPEDAYGGQRVTLLARLGPARLRVQVEVGIGDALTPEPEWLDYPSLLDLPRPRLRAYRPETAIAEKVHAMVLLGSKNSRMRDFFDVHALAMHEPFRAAGRRGARHVRAPANGDPRRPAYRAHGSLGGGRGQARPVDRLRPQEPPRRRAGGSGSGHRRHRRLRRPRACRRGVRHGVLRTLAASRQALALDRVLDQGRLTIGDFAALCPGVNRRTLQRDLRDMVEKGLLATEGQTNRLEYVAGKGVT